MISLVKDMSGSPFTVRKEQLGRKESNEKQKGGRKEPNQTLERKNHNETSIKVLSIYKRVVKRQRNKNRQK